MSQPWSRASVCAVVDFPEPWGFKLKVEILHSWIDWPLIGQFFGIIESKKTLKHESSFQD